MSKKKSFSGSTMTLKDFHGGSIPSDIPLPSAPGVVVRPTDRPGFDRQGSWGNPMGRPDHRLRPSSSGSIRSLDDKSPFLTNTAHIGRNFDEDERKPLDGVSGPRRTVSDETVVAPPVRMEPRSDVGRFMGNPGSAPLSQHVFNPSGGPYTTRVAEPAHMGSAPWSSAGGGGGSGHGFRGGPHPNAWAARKEVVVIAEATPSPYVGQSSVSKFAQASALDKVSSGRWQTKPAHQPADVEIIRQVESPNSLHSRGSDAYHGINPINERGYGEKMLVRHVERGLTLEDGTQNVAKDAPLAGGERIRSPILLDARGRASGFSSGGGQPHPDGKYAETLERPKLKLLPRTKPLEATEQPPVEYKQNFQQQSDIIHMETINEPIVNASHVKPAVTAGVEEGKQMTERPRLNLKPRSQPHEQTEENAERVRMAVFGGARPRELVLKQREGDDVVNNQEVVQSPIRVKKDSSRTETIPVHSNAVRRSENPNVDHKTGKIVDRREQRADPEKTELQRKSWRNENWRNEKQAQGHYQQERPPSPETWRKPVDQPKPADTDGSGMRFGKAVSALELAQAFSRSVSDPKPNAGQFSGPKGVPSPKGVPGPKGVPARTQVPFSRLTGSSTTRPQINGY